MLPVGGRVQALQCRFAGALAFKRELLTTAWGWYDLLGFCASCISLSPPLSSLSPPFAFACSPRMEDRDRDGDCPSCDGNREVDFAQK